MRCSIGLVCVCASVIAGCGDAAPVATDAGADAAAPIDAGPDSGPMWIGPVAPEAPRFASCPAGWRPITSAEGIVVGCDPWPASGRATCTAPDEAHFPGEPGCVRVGSACPAGEFPEGLPGGATVVYVRKAGPYALSGSARSPKWKT